MAVSPLEHSAYQTPTSVADALSALADGRATVLAGGTDFYPARVGRPLTEPVVDVAALDELRGITESEAGIRIGALTTWSEVIAAKLPPAFDGLKSAARAIGGVQIQNVATVAGNLCNASPAADGVPPLLTLDASVEMQSATGVRTLPLNEFITGYRTTALGPGELVTAVTVPATATAGVSSFHKLGSRRYLVISIAMVAARLEVAPDRSVVTARIAVGACSPVAQRLTTLEGELVAKVVDESLPALATSSHLETLTPIDDARAPAEYRYEAALVLVRRALAATTRGEADAG